MEFDAELLHTVTEMGKILKIWTAGGNITCNR